MREGSKCRGENKAEDREGWSFKYNVKVGHTEKMPSEQKWKAAGMSCGDISVRGVPGRSGGDRGREK